MSFFRSKPQPNCILIIANGEKHRLLDDGLVISDEKLQNFLVKWKLEPILAIPQLVVIHEASRIFGVPDGNEQFALTTRELAARNEYKNFVDRLPRKILVTRHNPLADELSTAAVALCKKEGDYKGPRGGGDFIDFHREDDEAITVIIASTGAIG